MCAPFVPSLQREAGSVSGELLQEENSNLPLSAPIPSPRPQQTPLAVLSPAPHPDFLLVPFFQLSVPLSLSPRLESRCPLGPGALIGTGRLLSCFLRGSERQRL